MRVERTEPAAPLGAARSVRRSAIMALAGAFVSGVLIVVLLPPWLRARSHATVDAPLATAAATPAPPAVSASPAAPATAAPDARPVHVHVVGPAGAELEIDGVARGRLPADVTLPARAGTRSLVVLEDGRRWFSRTIAADRDADVTAARAPRPAPRPKAKAKVNASEIENPFAQ